MGTRSALARLGPFIGLLLALGAMLRPGPATAAYSAPAVEASVLAKVDAGSPGSFELHRGLADVARDHSMAMAARKELSHNGADERPESAEPVPAERNGAPDDGHAPPSVSCENVAYVFPADSDPAAEIYRLWLESPPHKACMDRTDTNVAGVGVYFDGERWWATYVAMTDRTPPSSAGTSESEQETESEPGPEPKRVAPSVDDPDDGSTVDVTASSDEQPASVGPPTATEPATSERSERSDPEPTSHAEAAVELPPIERTVVHHAAAADRIGDAQHRPALPDGALVLVIALAALGMWFVWRTSVEREATSE